MMLTRRERAIALATLAVFALLGLDRMVLAPIEDRRSALAAERRQVVAELDRARALFAQRGQTGPEWQAMVAAGLGDGPTQAESRLLQAIRDWAQEAGLALTSLRPDKATETHKLQELTFHTAGEGGMKAVVGFLWRLETSPLPVRPTEVRVAARKEGSDELSLQVTISALCQANDTISGDRKPASRPQEETKSHD